MPNGKRDLMAQAVYLAQLEAARGNCKCNTCKLLRKGSKAMTEQFLNPTVENPGDPEGAIEAAKKVTGEMVTLGEEDD